MKLKSPNPGKRTVVVIIVLILLCLLIWIFRPGRFKKNRVSAFMHHYFESIRDNEAALTGFFSEMPKGGDLHHHYAGSIYAESLLQIAIDKKLWIHIDSLKLKQTLTAKEKKDGKYKQIDILAKQREFGEIKQRLFQEWSVKDYYEGYRASDKHFFESFGKFPRWGWKEMGEGLIELKQRAQKENVRYIETMLTSIYCDTMIKESRKYDSLLRMNTYADSATIRPYLDIIRNEFIQKSNLLTYVKAFNDSLNRIHTQSGVDDSSFTMRYLAYANRGNTPVRFFRDLLLAFEVANTNPLVGGVNILSPEDGDVSMRDYRLHMYMFNYCHRLYDSVKYSMHAGELTLGLVKPEDLTFHIRDAVYIAGAQRIGHGVDMAYEQDYAGLLDHMKEKNIAIEINLVSNEFILKVKGGNHPVTLYKKHNVPIVISTDDVGILRSNLLQQFVLLSLRYREISYEDIKTFIYNSIRYSFIKDDKLKGEIQKSIEVDISLFEKKIMDR